MMEDGGFDNQDEAVSSGGINLIDMLQEQNVLKQVSTYTITNANADVGETMPMPRE
jgi:hypothetical protein